jgi:hypothetical protein
MHLTEPDNNQAFGIKYVLTIVYFFSQCISVHWY